LSGGGDGWFGSPELAELGRRRGYYSIHLPLRIPGLNGFRGRLVVKGKGKRQEEECKGRRKR